MHASDYTLLEVNNRALCNSWHK